MPVDALNHVVLLVGDLDRSIRFYEEVLQMWTVRRDGVVSMHFQGGAVVLVEDASALGPAPAAAAAGSGSFGLLVTGTMDEWRSRIERSAAEVVSGPTERLASDGPVRSLVVRDPDGNVVELGFSARSASV